MPGLECPLSQQQQKRGDMTQAAEMSSCEEKIICQATDAANIVTGETGKLPRTLENASKRSKMCSLWSECPFDPIEKAS